MKVGIILDHYDAERGGMERTVAALAGHLATRGDEAHVYGLSVGARAPGVFHPVAVPKLPRGERERAFADRAGRAAREDGCDVTVAVRHITEVDVYWPHGGLHEATLAAGERSRPAMSRGVARLMHRLSPRHRIFLAMEDDLLSAGGAQRVWCVSTLIQDELAARYPACESRLELHRNGVDRGHFHPGLRDDFRDEMLSALGIGADSPVFLFLGGNWRLKGWRVMLSALSGILDLQWTCVAAGARSAEAALSAQRSRLGDRIVIAPQQDARALYGAADVLVQPTFRDPCSLATLEALAAGVPVVTTSANGAAEALRSAAAGSVVRPGSAGGLAVALSDWIERLADPLGRVGARREARESTVGRDAVTWLDGLVRSLENVASTSR